MHVQLTSSTLSILRISESKCLCCLPKLGLCSEVGASEVVPSPVIWSLSSIMGLTCGTLERDRGWKLFVHNFQQFAAKVRWKWHFREEPR